ncbi:MAG: hypothetical protein JST42_21135 [Bacteroidetes bacterium]|nr:hypothetical protein [Bacteroidota bacterium]
MKMMILSVLLYSSVINGQQIREAGGRKYEIIDTVGFYLYSCNMLVQGEKIARPQTVYFFSVAKDSPVLQLTMGNLEKAFASNPKFRYLLEASFHGDGQLTAYDKAIKMYKIKYLYTQAIK